MYEREDWNTVEVIVRGGDSVEHVVNGNTVFKAEHLQQPGERPDTWRELASGRIAFQAECAEVFYRNIEIRAIAGGPLKPNTAEK
jgi:hypothetical protein